MAEQDRPEGHEPRPPADLAQALQRALSATGVPGRSAADLQAAAITALRRALERPGRVRSSALELLVADALVTSACQAALQSDDPDAAIDQLVGLGFVP